MAFGNNQRISTVTQNLSELIAAVRISSSGLIGFSGEGNCGAWYWTRPGSYLSRNCIRGSDAIEVRRDILGQIFKDGFRWRKSIVPFCRGHGVVATGIDCELIGPAACCDHRCCLIACQLDGHTCQTLPVDSNASRNPVSNYGTAEV